MIGTYLLAFIRNNAHNFFWPFLLFFNFLFEKWLKDGEKKREFVIKSEENHLRYQLDSWNYEYMHVCPS